MDAQIRKRNVHIYNFSLSEAFGFDFEGEEPEFSIRDFGLAGKHDGIENQRYLQPRIYESIGQKLLFEHSCDMVSGLRLEPSMRMFALVSGNFIFGDVLEAMVTELGVEIRRMTIQTLSMSQANVDSLRNVVDTCFELESLRLVLSDYFYSHEKAPGRLVSYSRRNGIEDCSYTGNTDGVLTMHRWYQSTDCPGPWLSGQFERLSAEVNARLGGGLVVSTAAVARNNAHSGKLDVDGHGGYNTVLDMQHALGTWEDGVMSGQWRGNMEYLWAMEAVEWGGQGSQMVMALQRLVGAGVDGIWGRETSTKLQDRLIAGGYFCGDSGADGYFGRASVHALQQCLNDGRLA